MEQNASERITSIPPVDSAILNALQWKDSIGTLPGSNLHFQLNEFGLPELISDLEKKAVNTPTALAVKARFAPAAFNASAASSTTWEVPCGAVPSGTVPTLDLQTHGQMDCFKNGKPYTLTGSQQNRDSDSQVAGTDRPVKRVRRKRRLPLESEDDEENADENEEKNKSNNKKSRRNTKPIKQAASVKTTGWNWAAYLEAERMPAAPLKLFRERFCIGLQRDFFSVQVEPISVPAGKLVQTYLQQYQSFPHGRNGFKVGMKLEGLDPKHPSQFCVLTVAEVQGYRMRLHFDGYPECYDFWVNADSSDIHPVGWCEKTSHKLLPPKGYSEGEFNWTYYLKYCKAQAAPRSLFKTLSALVTPSGFRPGMKLEAVDKKDLSLMCVATIADMVDNRLLIHFDNRDESHDYWCEASSPYIRPVGYCQETGTPLTTPPGYSDSEAFSWEKYLEETNSQAAPARAFKLRPAHGFQVNTKLEAVDRRNPILIRVATIADADDHRIKIHFDGWNFNYDFWVDADSPDIHPVGWCARTGHTLQVPLGTADGMGTVEQACPTPGCHGVGHVSGPQYRTHHTLVDCPYSDENLSKEKLFQDRLSGERLSPSNTVQDAQGLETPAPLVGAAESSQEDSAQSGKSTEDSKKTCQSSVENLSEQSENNQKRTWVGENSSADIKPKRKMLGCSQAYIKFQLVKQEGNAKDPGLGLQQSLHQSIFMPSLASNPTHRLHLFWEKYCKILPEVSGLTAKDVAKWTVEEVVSFIQHLPGCKEHASVFREELIDGEAFLLLNQSDIIKILGIKLGPALKIYNAILMFKTAEEN